jgi:hypothetical protein
MLLIGQKGRLPMMGGVTWSVQKADDEPNVLIATAHLGNSVVHGPVATAIPGHDWGQNAMDLQESLDKARAVINDTGPYVWGIDKKQAGLKIAFLVAVGEALMMLEENKTKALEFYQSVLQKEGVPFCTDKKLFGIKESIKAAAYPVLKS